MRILEARPPADDDAGVNVVIAEHARQRPTSELWTTAIGGAMNAILLVTQFPSLSWLASAFTAVAAYGSWGLLDRFHSSRFTRGLVAVAGWSAALLAIITFMSGALGGLSLPGR
jgi:hypothetical protein